jgi:hypothetical protein
MLNRWTVAIGWTNLEALMSFAFTLHRYPKAKSGGFKSLSEEAKDLSLPTSVGDGCNSIPVRT